MACTGGKWGTCEVFLLVGRRVGNKQTKEKGGIQYSMVGYFRPTLMPTYGLFKKFTESYIRFISYKIISKTIYIFATFAFVTNLTKLTKLQHN